MKLHQKSLALCALVALPIGAAIAGPTDTTPTDTETKRSRVDVDAGKKEKVAE